MENKRNLRVRITILYIVYFATLLGGVIYNSGPAFVRGAKLGGKANDALFESINTDVLRSSNIYIDVPSVSGKAIDSFEVDDDKNTSVTMIASRCDILVTQDAGDDISIFDIIFSSIGGSAALYIGSLAIMAMYIIIFVLIFMTIHSLHKSVRHDLPLSPKCVWYTRAIGLLLIVINVLDSWGQWIMSNGAAKYLDGTDFTVNTQFTLNYYAIMMAVLIIFTAEIFSIGSKLGEDQKLTI